MCIHTDPDAVFSVLAATMRGLCRDRLGGLCPATRLTDVPGLDSLGLIHTVSLLEAHFRIEVDTEMLTDLHAVADIMRVIVAAKPQLP